MCADLWGWALKKVQTLSNFLFHFSDSEAPFISQTGVLSYIEFEIFYVSGKELNNEHVNKFVFSKWKAIKREL